MQAELAELGRPKGTQGWKRQEEGTRTSSQRHCRPDVCPPYTDGRKEHRGISGRAEVIPTGDWKRGGASTNRGQRTKNPVLT